MRICLDLGSKEIFSPKNTERKYYNENKNARNSHMTNYNTNYVIFKFCIFNWLFCLSCPSLRLVAVIVGGVCATLPWFFFKETTFTTQNSVFFPLSWLFWANRASRRHAWLPPQRIGKPSTNRFSLPRSGLARKSASVGSASLCDAAITSFS